MQSLQVLTLFLLCSALIGCGGGSSSSSEPVEPPPYYPPQTVSYTFDEDLQGFSVFSADYDTDHPYNDQIFIGLAATPEPFEYRNSLKFKWNNYSDDMKGVIFKQFDGLEANKKYTVTFELDLVTYISYECGGIGGSPSEGVNAKGAILNYKPERIIVDGDYRANVQDSQKGNNEGDETVWIGDIGLPTTTCVSDPADRIWEQKTIKNEQEFIFTNDNQGEAWLYISLDSGFEGVTEVYYTDLRVTYQKLN